MRRVEIQARGAILIIALVLMLAFLIFMVAGGQLITRQFHALTDQERRELTFQMAEAGLHYVLWELNHTGQLPGALPPITGQAVFDPVSGDQVGTFDVTTTDQVIGTDTVVTVTAIGRAENSLTTQTLVADVRSHNGSAYYIDLWDHRL